MKVAFLFPGQGSQSVGMLDSFETVDSLKAMIDEANTTLGFDLGGLIHSGPMETLSLTVNTQPAMLLTSLVMLRAWRDAKGPEPVAVAGHSLGEYSALCAAGMMTMEEALPLVRLRAQLMQDEVPAGTGGMAAVLGLDDEVVKEACQAMSQAGDYVAAVNFNSPGQIVIAGTLKALDAIEPMLKEKGAKRVMRLPVSAPFHSAMMKPAADKLALALNRITFKEGVCPVLGNVDAQAHTASTVASRLAEQAYSPVEWVKTLGVLADMGVTDVVEMGPGKVLTGLVKRSQPEMRLHNFKDMESMQAVLDTLASLNA